MKGCLANRSTGFCLGMLSAALLSNAAHADKKPGQDPYALQYEFGTAADLVVEPRWQNLPADATAKLEHIATHLGASKQFANIGEEWSPGDHFGVDRPRAQHLFSAYSDQLTASVFLVGGFEIRVYALVSRRRAESYCIFKLPELGMSTLRISIVQHELRPDRDETTGVIPKCQLQSVGQPLQLPSGG